MESAPVLVRHAGGVAALRQLPPGFRFRPTDEELVVQYLRRKAFGVPLPAAVIPVVPDLYSLDPWDIPADASEGEKYFFAVRTAGAGSGCSKSGGARAATASGRWKPAGKEKPVVLPRPCGGGSLLVGVKRTLTFVTRRKKKASAPSASLGNGWVMHEYRLAAPLHKNAPANRHRSSLCTARKVATGQPAACSQVPRILKIASFLFGRSPPRRPARGYPFRSQAGRRARQLHRARRAARRGGACLGSLNSSYRDSSSQSASY